MPTKATKQPLHPIYSNVSRVVAALLALNGMDQQDLAETLGMDPGVMSKRMSCSSAWRVEEISALAVALNVDEATFYTDAQTLTTTRQPFRPQPQRPSPVRRTRARSTQSNRQSPWLTDSALGMAA